MGNSTRKNVDNREVMANASSRAATTNSKQSTRSVSPGRMTSSPSSLRKSERLEKRPPPATPITRKSERLVKHSMPSPLRRSDRGKKHYSSSPLGSNRSGEIFSPADAKKGKEKKEKSTKQLTLEVQKVISAEKSEQVSISSKRKRMDGRSYKSLFKSQKRRYSRSDSDDKLERQDRLSEVDTIENGVTDCTLVENKEDDLRLVIEHPREPLGASSEAASPRTVPEFEDIEANMSENDVQAKVSPSSCVNYVSETPTDHLDGADWNIAMTGGTYKGTTDDANKGLKDHSSTEALKILELVDSIHIQRSAEVDISSERAAQIGKSKSPSCTRDIRCKVTDTEFGKPSSALVVEGAHLSPANLEKNAIVGGCVVCYKKQRLAYDSPEEELCSCTPVEKETGDFEPAFSSESVGRCADVTGLNETLSDVQTDSGGNVCVKCKQPRELLYCSGKGCRRCYHLSCLDPIIYDAPPGSWHCSYCTKKKIEFGIYAVTKGVESIWDSREVVVSDAKGTCRQKQYLVKYQGLAHVYNHWIPESQLLLETPSLVANYNAKNQRRVWNQEWTVPSRLLRKRPLVSVELEDKCSSFSINSNSDSRYEWLVKWCELDYVHATWELENSDFLQSPQGQKLIREYEIRYEKAKRVADKTTKGPFMRQKDRSDDCYLQNVNKLWELWYKGQNAIVSDEQERFANVIFFISSLLNDGHQPFLITSTSDTFSQWEAEFSRLAPSVDVVVYKGNIETRKRIRTLEFSEEDKGAIMLQVLLSPIEVVIEDLQFLKLLKWKVVVIDDCQKATPDLEQMKLLETDMRLLLFSGPIKDTIAEYSSMLSFLGSPDDPDKACGLKSDTADTLKKLKELLSRFIAHSKFVEYLVPVEISNLQLEQYCGKLLENALALRSNRKTDQVGTFKEIFMMLRQCCNHPYIVSSSLQSSIIEGLTQDQVLEVGIKASGKLQLLYEILSKIRNQQLRALVLYQTNSPGEMTIGDILDDFVRGKFGPNSYERIDASLVPSKKQAALNKFNDTGGEHFVFLLETRACQPSIKLSVDIVIIFDSDWTAGNDLKALQRLSILSSSEQINVFRLYSSCTIEEKVLIPGKQNLNLDSLQTIKFSSGLLMWGASYLFNRLEEYHAGNSIDTVSDISHGKKLLCDVLSELSAILSGSSKEKDKCEQVISRVFRNAGTYSTNFPLVGERVVQLTDVEEPHLFWKKLLVGKQPRWKFSSGQTPRSRKRVQYAPEVSRRSDCENEDNGRKRKKVVSTGFSVASVQLVQEDSQGAGSNKEVSMAAATNQSRALPVSVAMASNKSDAKNASSSLNRKGSFTNQNCIAHHQVKSLSDEQKSLHASLKEEMVKLSEVLKLSKDVKQMIDRFLEYVMENHHVNREPATILQAFQMSLCWTAASILKQKIDKKDSLEQVKQTLDFKCTQEEASFVYLKMRSLKKTFLQLPGINNGSVPQNFKSASRNISLLSSADTGNPPSGSFDLQNMKTNQELTQAQKPNSKLSDLEKRIKMIEKKCQKRIEKLHLKHQKEIQEFHKMWGEKKEKLEADHRKEVIFIRAIHGSGHMGMDKLKMSDAEFAEKMAEHERLKDMQLKELVAKHCAATEEETTKVANWLAEAKSCSNLCETVNEVCIRGSESEVSLSGKLRAQGIDRIAPASDASDVTPSNLSVASAAKTFGCKAAAETATILLNSNSEKVLETQIVESIPGVEQHKECCHSSLAVMDIPAVDKSNENHDNDKITGCERGHTHTIGTSTSEVQSADEIPSANQRHGMAIELGIGIGGLETTPDHALDNPIEFSLGNDRRNVSSDMTRNQKDQLAADLTDSLPSDAVVHLQNKESVDVQNEDATAVGAIPFDAGTSSLPNCEEIENEQLAQCSEGIAPCGSPCPAAEDVDQGHSLVPKSLLASPQLQEELVEVLDRTVSVPQEAENSVLPPVELLDSAQGQNPPDLLTDNRADHVPNSEPSAHTPSGQAQVCQNASELPTAHTPSGQAQAIQNATELPTAHTPSGQAQVSQNTVELPNQAISQSGPYSPMVEAGHFQLYGAHRVASHNAILPSHPEPLQYELERINKEMEQIKIFHESTKMQLKSNCEKEIEEMAAQIRKKYEAKLKDAEALYVLKKTEFESYQNKVHMNKILADAFKSRCLDLRSSANSGARQVAPSSFMQHLHQLSLRPATRCSPVISQHPVSLPVQFTHRAPGNFSGLPARPPIINAITPSIVNARVGGEVRAPAPHLQPFRPSACISSANMSSHPCNPNQQMPVNVPVTSTLLPPLPPQPALLTSSQASQPSRPPPVPQPPVNINQSGSGNQLSESEGGRPPSSHNTTFSALELLRKLHNQSSGRAPSLPPSSQRPNAGTVDLASDVVCLSDDDDD